MTTLKTDYLIEKRNVLNEIRANNMTLQELRFFSIYLSKINARDINTRLVRFPMADFQFIMELSRRIKIDYMKAVTANLLRQIVSVRDEQTGGYSQFQLFKECTVNQDNSGEWYVEIDAHDKALPLMFEFKNRYFSYQLWNALRLKSSNQLRMYELLKQYEKVGTRIWAVDELKKDLWLKSDEYPRYDNFKCKVLDVCQKALEEYTDIKFNYEPHGKKGTGGKILSLKFTILANENYADHLTLDMFIVENRPNEDNTNQDTNTNYLYINSTNINQSIHQAASLPNPAELDLNEKTDEPKKRNYEDYREIMEGLGRSGRMPATKERQYIDKWLDEYTMPLPVILEACDRAIINTDKHVFAYCDTILTNWHRGGVTSLDDVRRVGAAFAQTANSTGRARKPTRFANFTQREWDFEEVERVERAYLEIKKKKKSTKQ